jgi:hypothetical protein
VSNTIDKVALKVKSEVILDFAAQPQALKDYISTNYPDSSVNLTKEDDGGIELKLDDGINLIFETDGTFREIETHSEKNKYER